MSVDLLTLLLNEGRYAEFVKEIDQMNAIDAAEYLDTIDNAYLLKVFRLLKKDIAAEIFANLDTARQEIIITAITDSEITKLFDELYIDDTVDLLEELPANLVKRIIRLSTPSTRDDINNFLNIHQIAREAL